MNTEMGLYWLQQTLEAIVVLAGPVLMSALIVGLCIAVFQAVTSIQEMTLTYIPKMIVVAFVLFVLFGFMLQYAVDFTQRIILFIPAIAK